MAISTMTISLPTELKSVSAKLSQDGYVDLAGHRLWITPAEETDRPYIISTWIASYKQISRKLVTVHDTDPAGVTRNAKKVTPQLFQESYPRIPERLWKHAWVLRSEDGTAAHGYICGTNQPIHVLHYMYLPPELRGMGISKAMCRFLFGDRGYPVQVTAFLPWKRWPANWSFNPYGVFYGF